jgi:hypothetical protein
MLEATCGNSSYRANLSELLEPELSTNNMIKIHSGLLIHHGGLFLIEPLTYDEVSLTNGTQGMKRIDLVVARYTKNNSTGIENGEWIIIQGEPAQSDPTMPEYTVGNMQDGDLIDDCPVFAIHLDGLNVTKVEQLLGISPSMDELNEEIAALKGEVSALSDKSTRENVLWSTDDAVYIGTLELSDDLFKYKHLVFMEDNKVLFEIPVIQGMTEARDASTNLTTSFLNYIEMTSLNVTNITATSLEIAASQAIFTHTTTKPFSISKLYINKIIGIQ